MKTYLKTTTLLLLLTMTLGSCDKDEDLIEPVQQEEKTTFNVKKCMGCKKVDRPSPSDKINYK